LKLLVILSGLATIAVLATTNTADAAKPQVKNMPKKVHSLRIEISHHRAHAWFWQDVMFARRHPTRFAERRTKSVAYLRWLKKTWVARHTVAKRKASRPPHYNEWLCIHKYEGAWNDPNAPYYGGLQMDMSFQRTYGWNLLQRKGTADNWTPLEQMWVAERAYASGRGFGPWPNTARYCGLL
jgi:hypothetical protein